MFKDSDSDTGADAMANFNRMYGFDVPHDHHHHAHSPADNPHVKMVQYVLRLTKAEQVMELFNQLVKPMPDTA